MEGSAKRRRFCGNDGTARGASSTDASTEGQEVATSLGYDYEVFLSFRGPDTRTGFTDFLYTSLKGAGIRTFKDDEELRTGEEFAPELLQAINQSKISIPIFSKGYASSVWCLKELVQMVKCRKNGRQKIMPIFYDVAPSEVRYQNKTEGYAKALLLHKEKERYDEDTICEWKAALSAIGAINGWDLYGKTDRREGEFAKEVTKKVFRELKKAYLAVSDCLVNVDNQVDEIMEMIGAQTSETRIIGIHGMGGIGKTSIAKIIYNRLSSNFEYCCFLSNIRETSERKGIECLQNQLISEILKVKWMDISDVERGTETIKNRLLNKRVLLLLDDVDKKNHINAFVGEGDWFSIGSKIIITTRNENILHVFNVDHRYELKCMDHDQSLQLFSKHPFRRDYPLNEDVDHSNKAIRIARGLPLALEVIGSHLGSTKKNERDLLLKMLENVPPEEVQSKLNISYDALDFRQQHIFLDIACFFIGYDRDIVVHFWDESKYPKKAMEVLQNRSLIKFEEDNTVWMHDQLRDLGREIVRKKSNTNLKEQSRVWDSKEGLDLLRKYKGEKKVEALRLKLDNHQRYRFSYEGFENLSYLRFLEVDGSMKNFCAEERLLWPEAPSNVFPTNENSYLLPQLRWLSWRGIPPKFNITNFSVDDVVILNLYRSKITIDWKGWSHVEVMKNLKVLDMSNCQGLQRTPNFSTLSNLEHLILRKCISLIEIDRSICQLTCLASLDVSYCKSLQRLPDELGGGLTSLKYLSLTSCQSLERLPDSIGSLESLIMLDISYTSIKKLSHSIGNLKKLKVVKMQGSRLREIPNVLWLLGDLEEIKAGYYVRDHERYLHVQIGNDGIYGSQSLRILDLVDADIYALPRLPESLVELGLHVLCMNTFPDFSNLTNLKRMNLRFGDKISNGLGEHPMPRWIGNLSKLESLILYSHHVTTSPSNLSFPPQLKSLQLNCPNLRCLPRLPSSLSFFALNCGALYSMEDLSNLKKLSYLSIFSTAIAEIQGLGFLENLQEMVLYFLGQLEILPDLSNLNKLTSFHIGFCDKLVEIQGQLPRFLAEFKICQCGSLQKLPDLSSLMGKVFELSNCKNLNVETILNVARLNPRHFQFVNFEQLQILPDLSNSNELRHLQVEQCDNLVEIQGKLPQSLEVLEINSGKSLQKLPYLSSLIGLREVCIKNCYNLVEIPGELPESLEVLKIDSSCKSLHKLPCLTSLMKLQEFYIGHCNDLVEIQGELPQSLEKLVISYCVSLQKLPYLSSFIKLREFSIKNCDDLVEIPGELPQSLEVLKIDSSCKSLQKLPCLSSLMKLREFYIGHYTDLVEIQGELPQSLEKLVISYCVSLQKLPYLSSLIGLREFSIKNCDLVEILGKLPQSLEVLVIYRCRSLQELPNLSSLKGLRKVKIIHCKKLNVKAISSLCSEMSIKFVRVEDGDSEEDLEVDDEYDSEEDVEVDDEYDSDSEEDE